MLPIELEEQGGQAIHAEKQAMFNTGVNTIVALLVTFGLVTAMLPNQVRAAEALQTQEQSFDVNVDIALSSLASLGDGHLQKMADSLHILATTNAGRSANWDRIKEPYGAVAKRNAAALNWFALPDGSYWSVQHGEEAGNLSGRDYFPKALSGETVVGELLVSTATGKPMAVVAVPVVDTDNTVVGVLGASIYMEELSEVIRRQMGVGEGLIYFSFDWEGRVGLVWDPELIFFEPRKSKNEGLARAFDEMLSKDQGVVTYKFEGRERTVAYRKSTQTGWWYAFGLLH